MCKLISNRGTHKESSRKIREEPAGKRREEERQIHAEISRDIVTMEEMDDGNDILMHRGWTRAWIRIREKTGKKSTPAVAKIRPAMKKGANKLATIARQDRRRIHATADTRKWSAGDRNKKRATRKKSNSEDTVTEECRKAFFSKERRERKTGRSVRYEMSGHLGKDQNTADLCNRKECGKCTQKCKRECTISKAWEERERKQLIRKQEE